MRKRKGSSTGRRARSYKTTRSPSTRGKHTKTAHAVSVRRTTRRVYSPAIRSRDSQSLRTNRENGLHSGLRHRGTAVLARSKSAPARRLPQSVLSSRSLHENASSRKTTRGVCTRKKQERRAVIIATGYGGINNARNYRRQKKCSGTS